jgi:glycosyltransferase involved in cell wall biosynthesis
MKRRANGDIRTLRILGTRGIPAAHGGFETFAEYLSLYLIHRGWRVVVYCQEDGVGPIIEDTWQGVDRVRIPVAQAGPRGTVIFDWKVVRHAAAHRDLCLTLGYNTAVLCVLLRAKGIPNIINMDGLDWLRSKWGAFAKTWLYVNERLGCWLADHLVADHPEIRGHLLRRVRASKITMIPYGADSVRDTPTEPVLNLGLEPGRYLTLIARAEPENSILEVVRGFSQKRRGFCLAVLGDYDVEHVAYHREVKRVASDEVRFLGPIYDRNVVQALRFHSWAYIHGHQVGGTNPSLVEALGAGNAVLARDNKFNRWVAGPTARYFSAFDDFARQLQDICTMPDILSEMQMGSLARFEEAHTWPAVLAQYEALLERFLPK